MADHPALLINCVIADDEPIARMGMQQLVRQVSFLRLAGVAKDALEVNNFLTTTKVDLLFLDIQMPKISGIDYLKTLQYPPQVIFTTAFAEYAVEGYELDILDFLLKPITLPRFLKAVNKARDYFEQAANNTTTALADDPYIFVKTNKQLQKILFEEILFVEAMLNYVVIYTAAQKFITYASMKTMQESLPAARFLKIHKSYIIAVAKIKTIEGNMVSIGNHQLPVSRAHKEALIAAVQNRGSKK